ncbi:SAVED domain-containing protein [Tessaracoccus rhinocerotis]|uniref:SAVED domain-containing protein n=1 Tax=Tessaracoccus rhinocerotis TaxID=1689449 RepID=A0A553K3W9_9ACTN|nr:SAVED domain-containing protein [Tessaracoccus rhinocerotis]TRY19402.1 SAVED domain-containing protein [Tessaracoccus rhinocerotis]
MHETANGAAASDTEPTNPVFISYRQSDGTAITTELAWLLRAAGIPVWRDRDDLPPGDTETRLQQAIADGLAGGVLTITPDIANSTVVREVEAPKLIALHEAHEEFALCIANAVEREPGKLDYDAPDRLLELKPKTLSGVDQHPVDRAGQLVLTKKLLWHRLTHQQARVASNNRTIHISIQTRNAPQVLDRTGHQLDMRVRPSSHERLPSPEGLRDLQDTIHLLPDAVTRTGAQTVHIHGGAHLSVAFAIGAALPSSRIGTLHVTDQRQQTWMSGTEAIVTTAPLLRVEEERTSDSAKTGRPAVALYLDLLPGRSDYAFIRHLEENGSFLTAWEHLTYAGERLLDPTDAGLIAAEAAARIRTLSNHNGNAQVHLLLRCPFPVAVLIGRLMNTIRFVLYEWDDSDPVVGDDYRARYVAAMRVRPSASSGVIEEVLLKSSTGA